MCIKATTFQQQGYVIQAGSTPEFCGINMNENTQNIYNFVWLMYWLFFMILNFILITFCFFQAQSRHLSKFWQFHKREAY